MLQVAVLEDEQESRVQIKRCLERYQAENHAEWDMDYFSSGAELLFSGASGYDMLLMDIEMPQMSGIEVARRVRREDQHVAIVFITNMANYALQGYEVEAMDFIVKPYTYEVFQFRMDRVVHRVERKKSNRAVLLTSNDQVYRVLLSELLYVEVAQHTLIYHTEQGEIAVRGSMREAEKALMPYGFCKCSQSYLIHLRFVTRVKDDEVFLNKERIHISRGSKKELIRALAEYTANG